MHEILAHPWVRVLLAATTVAMCSFALRETASITLPVVRAVIEVAVPVAIGFTIAYILTPLVDLIARRYGTGRVVATGALFLSASVIGIGGLALVVPLLARQSSELATQIVRGEPFVDLDGNGRWDPGEPFTDLNGNGVHDAAVIGKAMAWVQDRQERIKRFANLAVDEAGLAMLAVYLTETAGPRQAIERLLDGGESEAAPIPGAPNSWDSRWPGPDAETVAAAVAQRPGIAPALYAQGAALAAAHLRSVQAMRLLRGGGEDETLASHLARLRQGIGHPLSGVDHAIATAALHELEEAEQAGHPAATELLTELRGGSSAAGASALARALARIEDAAKRNIDSVPDRIGDWAEASLSNVSGILLLLLDALLVPIYAFFLILVMPRLRTGLKQLVPTQHAESTLRIVREIEAAVSAFFRGRLIICVLCALVGVAGFLVVSAFGVRVPYGILFGVLLGLVTPIPLAGIVVAVPALVLTMIQPGAGPADAVAVVGVYLLVQATEAVLIPWILGREVEIHPLWLIIALLLCGKVLGVLGLILAVPIAACVRILGREYLWPRLKAWAARGVEAVQPPLEEGAAR